MPGAPKRQPTIARLALVMSLTPYANLPVSKACNLSKSAPRAKVHRERREGTENTELFGSFSLHPCDLCDSSVSSVYGLVVTKRKQQPSGMREARVRFAALM